MFLRIEIDPTLKGRTLTQTSMNFRKENNAKGLLGMLWTTLSKHCHLSKRRTAVHENNLALTNQRHLLFPLHETMPRKHC